MIQQHIGALAARLGLNPKTIRYYEGRGLLPAPARTQSGYRLYTPHDEARLHFILKAKEMGFTLAEIGEILAVQAAGTRPCYLVLRLLDQKVVAVDQRLETLTAFRAELVVLRDKAAQTMQHEANICGIIEAHTVTRRAEARGHMRKKVKSSDHSESNAQAQPEPGTCPHGQCPCQCPICNGRYISATDLSDVSARSVAALAEQRRTPRG
jgi:MerR family transcriptional regulator, Zn(II)-responsive regulator of zntA